LRVIILLKEFGNLIDFLGHLCWGGWRKRRDISRFNNLLTLVIDWSFGDLWVKFEFYLVSEQGLEVVHIKTVSV